MDDNLLSSGIDAYARVEFAGNQPLQSSVVTQKGKAPLDVEINQSLFLPVMVPTMTDRITVSIWDKDAVGSDEAVGYLNFKFSNLQALQVRDLHLAAHCKLLTLTLPHTHTQHDQMTRSGLSVPGALADAVAAKAKKRGRSSTSGSNGGMRRSSRRSLTQARLRPAPGAARFGTGPFWAPMYGAAVQVASLANLGGTLPTGVFNKHKDKMTRYPHLGSTYRGKVTPHMQQRQLYCSEEHCTNSKPTATTHIAGAAVDAR